jgi:hypothetical protein
LTDSRCRLLLRRTLRLGLGLSLLNPPLLSYVIRGERIVVDGNERVVIEMGLTSMMPVCVPSSASGADTDATRSAGTVACRRRTGVGLAGSRRRLLRLALRLSLRWLSLCLHLLSQTTDVPRRCGPGRLARLLLPRQRLRDQGLAYFRICGCQASAARPADPVPAFAERTRRILRRELFSC